MDRQLKILYRGPLASCNYSCGYCPFAKRRDSPQQLDEDLRCLTRFVDWVEQRTFRKHEILFTPWGEALTRSWYRDSMTRLSRMENVEKVSIQTNISVKLDWLDDVNKSSLALWCTYHPNETTLEKFVRQCRQLDDLNIRYSVGVVGLRENLQCARMLREALPSDVYLWVNAYKSEPHYYDNDLFKQFEAIDPLFPTNAIRHSSLGKECRTGDSVVSIDGAGNVRRCHFVDSVLGNIYDGSLEEMLRARACPNPTCGCHIGYVHLNHLDLYSTYQDGIMERVPAGHVWQRTTIDQVIDEVRMPTGNRP